METFGGSPFSDLPLSGSQAAAPPVGTDTVTLSSIAETTALVALTTVVEAGISAITETTSLQALVTSEYGDPRLFYWPNVAGYQINPLVDPLDELHFYEVDTTTAKQVSASADFTQLHTNPVKVDRLGNIPAVYVDATKSYRFILKNRYGVTKWEAGSYTWPNTVEDHVSLSPIPETTTLVALTTSEP